jgi:hypothetical protein
MGADPAEPENNTERLREVLLDYLKANWAANWPGGDGLTVGTVLNSYLDSFGGSARRDGWPLNHAYPGLDAAVQAWLASQGRLGMPLPAVSEGTERRDTQGSESESD